MMAAVYLRRKKKLKTRVRFLKVTTNTSENKVWPKRLVGVIKAMCATFSSDNLGRLHAHKTYSLWTELSSTTAEPIPTETIFFPFLARRWTLS